MLHELQKTEEGLTLIKHYYQTHHGLRVKSMINLGGDHYLQLDMSEMVKGEETKLRKRAREEMMSGSQHYQKDWNVACAQLHKQKALPEGVVKKVYAFIPPYEDHLKDTMVKRLKVD